LDTQQLFGTIAAIVACVTALSGILYSIYRVARRLDSAIGVDSKGRTISERLDRVEHQLWRNGGDSLADHVEEVRMQAKQTTAEIGIMKDLLLRMIDRSTSNED
jgi:hypothetical protein